MVNLKEKNLLVICDGYPSKDNEIYSGIFIKQQLKYIAPHFNKVFVISPTPYFPNFLSKYVKKYNYLSHLINYATDNIIVFYPRYFSIPVFKYINKKYRETAFRDCCIKTIIKERINFNIIHAHFINPPGIVANELKNKYSVPYILTVHEDSRWLDKKLADNDLEVVLALKSADVILRVNNKDVFKLKKYNQNVHFLPNGYDSEIFYSSQVKKKKGQTITCVGNLMVSQKNQINLINAINLLIKKYPNLKLNIIGDGIDKIKIQLEIDKLKLNDNIELLGSKKPKDIKVYLDQSDVFVLPSYSESFGIVQIEAMACGVPVVATINGGSEEIITSKDLGILVKNPENVKELSEAIDFALNKKWNKNKIINYSRKYMLNLISKKIISKYARLKL